ncbi:MAG TPA: DUF4157 domain-containing protein, partial [Kofleriaceae bacterium]|nr:DUF4157 domain-containing protein [Kofleriaceae bacterium]
MDERQAKRHVQPARREASPDRRMVPPRPRRTIARHAPSPAPVTRTAGRPLDDGTRARMEARLGHDFSRVRVHHDGESARL